MTRIEAESVASTGYGTSERAVVELLLLADAGDAVLSHRALRALEWFDPKAQQEPARPPGVLDPPSEVEAVLDALRFTLYGWSRESRIAAAAECCWLVRELAERAERRS